MISIHALVLSLLLADVPSPVTAAVTRYEAAVQELEAKRKGSSVQRVYEAAAAAAEAIGRSRELSDEEAATLQESLPALRVRDASRPPGRLLAPGSWLLESAACGEGVPSPARGRGWREAPGEGVDTARTSTPQPAFGHLLPASRGEGSAAQLRS